MMSAVRHSSFSGLVAVLAVAVSACGGGGGEAPAVRSSPSPTATVTEEVHTDCDKTLSSDELEDLAGASVGEPRPGDTIRSACRWDAVDGDTWVQVLDTDSSAWSASLPGLIDTLRELPGYGDDPKLEKALALIENGGVLDPVQACDLFGRMVALQGMPAGSDEIINYVPTEESPQGINAQSCREGRYHSVLLASPSLQAGPDVERRVARALRALDD